MEDKLLRSRGSGAKILSAHSASSCYCYCHALDTRDQPRVPLQFLFSAVPFYLALLPRAFESLYTSYRALIVSDKLSLEQRMVGRIRKILHVRTIILNKMYIVEFVSNYIRNTSRVVSYISY